MGSARQKEDDEGVRPLLKERKEVSGIRRCDENVGAHGLRERAEGGGTVMNGGDNDEGGNYFKVGEPWRHEVDICL